MKAILFGAVIVLTITKAGALDLSALSANAIVAGRKMGHR
jgi:hypothetical protein